MTDFSSSDSIWRRPPFEHQTEIAQFHYSSKNTLDASEVGVGKTAPAIVALQRLFLEEKIHSALIIAPNSILDNWAAELRINSSLSFTMLRGTKEKRIDLIHGEPRSDLYLINYEAVRTVSDHLQWLDCDLILCDECFPWETEVITNFGVLPIGFIVDHALDLYVLSCNLSSETLEWKQINRYIKKSLSGPLVRIKHETGTFVCTANHKIWTEENGYKEAISLSQGNHLWGVWQEAHHLSKRYQESNPFLQPSMREFSQLVEFGICSKNIESSSQTSQAFTQQSLSSLQKDFSTGTARASERTATFLQQIVLRKMANATTGNTANYLQPRNKDKDFSDEDRQEKSLAFGIPENSQSNVQSYSSGKGEIENGWTNILGSRRQRSFNSTAENNFFIDGSMHGVRNSNIAGQVAIPIIANSLQGGLSTPRKQDSNRNRRDEPQYQKMEIFRQAERGCLSRSRVVSIEVLEQGSSELNAFRSRKNQFVYNLEIEGNHNYFANKTLVSNCHHIKSFSSQQTKHILALGKMARARKGMTGTLLTNDILDLWAIAQFIDPKIFATNYWGYRNRYMFDANAGKKWLKFPDWQPRDGAIEEVQRILEPHCIRFEKRQVLKFLPPVLFEKRYVDLSGEQARAYNELKRHFITELNDGVPLVAPQILGRVMKLLEIASGFAYREGDTYRFEENAKLKELRAVQEEIGDSQAIVWCAFDEDIKTVLRSLDGKGEAIYGEIKAVDRQPIVDRFNRGEFRYLVANAACAGEGLNLTGASYAIYFSRSYKLGEKIQSLGRFDRPGSEKHSALTVIDIVARNTVDEQVIAALDGKEDLLKSVNPKRWEGMLQ